jgi:hypothetical protein
LLRPGKQKQHAITVKSELLILKDLESSWSGRGSIPPLFFKPEYYSSAHEKDRAVSYHFVINTTKRI